LDFCNDAVQLKYYRDAVSILPLKQYTSIPAVKLTRIGVNKKFHGKNIGTKTINMIKAFFISDNRTGCRLITVDAYNKPRVLNFYAKNGFKEFPKQQTPRPDEGTRALYFDLKRLSL